MANRPSPVAIRLAGITATFRQRGRGDVIAVDAVDLTVEPGELLTLLGPSGCGKTTMLRMIAGFQEPTAGAIFIGERDVTRLPANRRDIGLVFQSYALFPHLTVFENVAYGLRVRRRGETDIRATVEDVLGLVGLGGFTARLPNELSGGQQQRVALARAIVIEPRVLLFDEPLSNLDAKLRVEMRDEIHSLQRRLGITTVYVTHDQEEAMAISDRIAVMQGGRVVQLGTAETLYRHPASSFVAGFLGHANILQGITCNAADQAITIELAGQTLTLPTTQAISPETKVTAVIRPEAISIASAGDGLRAKLTGRVYLGGKVEYTVEIGGISLQVVKSDPPEGETLELGQEVLVRFSSSGVQVLIEDD